MISQSTDPEAWALLLMDLEEVQEHLAELIVRMDAAGQMDEAEFAVELGHVYAHLNRIWHARDGNARAGDEEWSEASKFPGDIKLVG